MRRDDLSSVAFSALFKRLCLGYRHTIPPAEIPATVEVYFTTLKRFAEPIVGQVVELLLRGGGDSRYFPKAGELYRLCLEAEVSDQRRHGQQHHAERQHGCPWCGKEFWVAGYECGNGVVVGRLRCACRQAGYGWDTPAARSWQTSAAPITPDALKAVLTAPEPRRVGARDPEDIRAAFRLSPAKVDEPPPPDEPADEMDPLEEMALTSEAGHV